ncbi:hypothetical protein K435DRAFT_849410 [Dendrothele bispora CBS 962.96]|uniref:Uncharacterized protein n=1 Tax=Dendrothele bispora (strain CBS 962.96) TaxID=1314807 RepID=A0A4S8MU76_DENBC|nr:hypothetical protein K435DRAFT_849410 [Dendrothele bispora CBS 962.96]
MPHPIRCSSSDCRIEIRRLEGVKSAHPPSKSELPLADDRWIIQSTWIVPLSSRLLDVDAFLSTVRVHRQVLQKIADETQRADHQAAVDQALLNNLNVAPPPPTTFFTAEECTPTPPPTPFEEPTPTDSGFILSRPPSVTSTSSKSSTPLSPVPSDLSVVPPVLLSVTNPELSNIPSSTTQEISGASSPEVPASTMSAKPAMPVPKGQGAPTLSAESAKDPELVVEYIESITFNMSMTPEGALKTGEAFIELCNRMWELHPKSNTAEGEITLEKMMENAAIGGPVVTISQEKVGHAGLMLNDILGEQRLASSQIIRHHFAEHIPGGASFLKQKFYHLTDSTSLLPTPLHSICSAPHLDLRNFVLPNRPSKKNSALHPIPETRTRFRVPLYQEIPE